MLLLLLLAWRSGDVDRPLQSNASTSRSYPRTRPSSTLRVMAWCPISAGQSP